MSYGQLTHMPTRTHAKSRIPRRQHRHTHTHRLVTDSPDTSIGLRPYVRYARFPCDDPSEDVGVVECQLNTAFTLSGADVTQLDRLVVIIIIIKFFNKTQLHITVREWSTDYCIVNKMFIQNSYQEMSFVQIASFW